MTILTTSIHNNKTNIIINTDTEISFNDKPINATDEVWIDVVGYETLYKVSNRGRIWSCYTKRILKQQTDKDGYFFVNLYKKQKMKTIRVHRIVALAFVHNTEGKPTVNHKNEIKTDNCVENLEWATVQEQNVYGTRIHRAMKTRNMNKRKKQLVNAI